MNEKKYQVVARIDYGREFKLKGYGNPEGAVNEFGGKYVGERVHEFRLNMVLKSPKDIENLIKSLEIIKPCLM